ncbi:hypothetical protein [Luteococcus japonicus]|uniref:hypothetical protein n=1 Tax=Luteococcus japonicus TaxID=33984 RepID=UPI0011CE1DC7|nr:hypothetical protein [Luteococcus japonicus]
MKWLRELKAWEPGVRDVLGALVAFVGCVVIAVATWADFPELSAASRGEGIQGSLHVESRDCSKSGCTNVGTFTAPGLPPVHAGVEGDAAVGSTLTVQYFPETGNVYPLGYSMTGDMVLGVVSGLVVLGMAGLGAYFVVQIIREERRMREMFPPRDPNLPVSPRRAQPDVSPGRPAPRRETPPALG